ncbi:hypothetical protein TWF718_010530 [Orbilia javanica]|uniref:Secreted protein n=1 Tax=Orbilia javanica TaxID=47235 RepID=A0AAN8MR46_9PEZI
MYLKTLLPILCLTSSISSLTVPARDGAEVAGQQNPAKRDDSWGVPGPKARGVTENPDAAKLGDKGKARVAAHYRPPKGLNGDRNKPHDGDKPISLPFVLGPGPVIVDPASFPALESTRKNRKNRRSPALSKKELLPETLGVPLEQVTQWMSELDSILGEGSLGNAAPGDLKKRYTEAMANAWFSFGAPNDFRLLFDPSQSGPTEDYAPANANSKRDETGLTLKSTGSTALGKRSKAVAEILDALRDQEDINGTGADDKKQLDRRAAFDVTSSPIDEKPVQDEVIRRIFKLYQKKGFKRDLVSRQSSQEVAQQILQTLFRFEDDEEWKWNAPVSARKRWSEWPEIEEISEHPEKRNHKSGGAISTDEIHDTGSQDPSSYAWPDISLKVREALPREADIVSQRIIVTIFRMQEDFKHKRSLIEVEQQVKETSIKPRGTNALYGWLGAFAQRTRDVRLKAWIRKHMRHYGRRSTQAPESNLQRRAPISISDVNKIKSLCPKKGVCFLPWQVRKLQNSTSIVRRIVDTIDRHSQYESQIVKRDVASDILAWLENVTKYFEVHRYSYPGSDGQPIATYVSGGPQEKPLDGTASGGSITRRLASPGQDVIRPQLEGTDFMELMQKLRKEIYGDSAPDSVVFQAAWDIVHSLLGAFLPHTKRDTTSKGTPGILDSVKLAIRSKISSLKLAIRSKISSLNLFNTSLEKRQPQSKNDGVDETVNNKLKKRYDPESFPWWSGSSEDNAEEYTPNPWAKSNSCARLKLADGCAGGYKRSVADARKRLHNFRKRIEQDEKEVSEKQTIGEDLAERDESEKEKQRSQALTRKSDWKDPGFIRLDPFSYYRKNSLRVHN